MLESGVLIVKWGECDMCEKEELVNRSGKQSEILEREIFSR